MNENQNGLLRLYIQKKMSSQNNGDHSIKLITNKLNNRPRKTLGFYTPKEVLCDQQIVDLFRNVRSYCLKIRNLDVRQAH